MKKAQNEKQTAFEYINCKRGDKIDKILNSIQQKFEQFDGRHLECLYRCFAVTLSIRVRLNDNENWKNFCANSYWDNRKPRYRPKIEGVSEWDKTRFLAIAVFAGPKQVRIDRASKYAFVLEHYRLKGLIADRLPAQLKEDGGIDKVLKRCRSKAEAEAKNISQRAAAKHNNDSGEIQKAETTDDKASSNSDPEQNVVETASKSKAIEKAKKPQRLVLDATDALISKALSIPIGTKFRISAIREKSDGAWKVIRVRKINL